MANRKQDALDQMLNEAQARPGVAEVNRVYGQAQKNVVGAYRIVISTAPVMRSSANISR
jgi:hypothetical protein